MRYFITLLLITLLSGCDFNSKDSKDLSSEEKPTTEEPVEEEPVEDPVEEDPVEEDPVEDDPVEDDPVEDESAQDLNKIGFWGFEYVNHGLKFGTETVKGVYAAASSENGQNYIISKLHNGKTEVFTSSDSGSTWIKHSDNDAIEFDVAANNNGNFAYIVQNASGSGSEVFYQGKKIDIPEGLYKNLALNNEWLIFNNYQSSSELNTLWFLDLATGSLNSSEIDFFPNKILFQGDALIAEGIDISSHNSKVYQILPASQMISALEPSGSSCFIKGESTVCFDENETTAKLVHMINSELAVNDPLLALSCGTGTDGRLSWTVSYKIISLIKLLELERLLGQENSLISYPTENTIKYAVNCLFSSVGEYSELEQPFWPTQKYSIDKTQLLSLAVNDGMVLYSLLKAANQGLLTQLQVQYLDVLVNSYYEYHEPDFNYDKGQYHFRYGTPYWADGVVLPWNMSAVVALTFGEAYKLTNHGKFKERLLTLTGSFVDSWKLQSDGRLFWSYWPDEFYLGWTAEDSVSSNTASRTAREDTLYEGLAHAGLNVWLANYVLREFPNEINGLADYKETIHKTVDGISENGFYSRFMSGDAEYRPLSRVSMPRLGWAELGHCGLNLDIAKGYLSYTPQLSQNNELNYINVLINELQNESSSHCFK